MPDLSEFNALVEFGADGSVADYVERLQRRAEAAEQALADLQGEIAQVQEFFDGMSRSYTATTVEVPASEFGELADRLARLQPPKEA